MKEERFLSRSLPELLVAAALATWSSAGNDEYSAGVGPAGTSRDTRESLVRPGAQQHQGGNGPPDPDQGATRLSPMSWLSTRLLAEEESAPRQRAISPERSRRGVDAPVIGLFRVEPDDCLDRSVPANPRRQPRYPRRLVPPRLVELVSAIMIGL